MATSPTPPQKTAAKAKFQDLTADAGAQGEVNFDLIMDVTVNVTLEVGHAEITVRELLQLTQGSILELDRPAGDPLDVLVNGVRVARGEVVVVNDKFGIRLTEVISPHERMEQVK
ncbi:MAG TPA: flagellar motor switch protein FliN [Steroidobacteraceae bacterium]|nr:flagellar motor switch protein FliN [Steroidobacteraceae bacterium]